MARYIHPDLCCRYSVFDNSLFSTTKIVSFISYTKTSVSTSFSNDMPRPLSGFEVCVHSCQSGHCHGFRYKHSVLWKKEGHAAASHAQNRAVHLNCESNCPGYAILGVPRKQVTLNDLVRQPTTAEIQQHLLYYPEDAKELNINIKDDDVAHSSAWDMCIDNTHSQSSSTEHDVQDPSSTSSGQSVVDLNAEVDNIVTHSTTDDRCFKLVYIPDPTCRTTITKAIDNLSFIKTKVTPQEFESIKHLDGSVFKTGKLMTVYMEEWVS